MDDRQPQPFLQKSISYETRKDLDILYNVRTIFCTRGRCPFVHFGTINASIVLVIKLEAIMQEQDSNCKFSAHHAAKFLQAAASVVNRDE
ncbi:hypothetical protein RRG08_022333 [Elysia crispata]|uniref:Uncharacterized protein n=1 Tax=Elysia crispata TaxID=231223 RepID=A0AAE0Z1F6_9GAST|nr:hypothetical protein RRG08_022333 [Elysia crispata]